MALASSLSEQFHLLLQYAYHIHVIRQMDEPNVLARNEETVKFSRRIASKARI